MPDNPFWNYSLQIYACSEVREICLFLQTEYGVDVNLMLYMIWRASCGDVLRTEQLRALDQQVRPWRESVVYPLRELRVKLRDQVAAETTREKIKGAELESEHHQQDLMYALNFTASYQAPQDESFADNTEALSGFYGLDNAALQRLREVLQPRFNI